MEEEKSVENNGVVGKNIVEPNKSIVAETLEEVDKDDEVTNRTNNELVKSAEKDLTGEKMECEAHHSLPVEPMRKAMLNKMITKKEDKGGNFVIPYNVGGLKYMDALVDQGSDVNVMPLSTYNRLTNKKLAETDIRLSLASQSHIQPPGITEDVPFMTTAKAEIRFDKGEITLKSGKSKSNFGKTPKFLFKFKEREKDIFDPVTPTSIVSKLISEWEERIKLHQEKEMEFNQWRSKVIFDEKKPRSS
ncbi:MAK10-like protein [Tanacetum coccineum]